MKRNFRRLGRALAYLRQQLSFNKGERAFFDQFAQARPRGRAPARPVIAVQAVAADLFYFGIFGELVSSLRRARAVRVDAIATQSLAVAESHSWLAFAGLRLALNPLLVGKWLRLYRSFCDGIAYRSVSLEPIDDLVDLRRAQRCWRGLSSRQALMDLQIEGIRVGDLVNDSYLRFKPAPTVDLQDPYLRTVLWQVFRDLRRAITYFSKARPAVYLTSYTTYIQHGVAARVALKYGARVFAFGNFQDFAKEITQQDWVHTRAPDRLATDFAKLPDQAVKIELARKGLGARVAGVIDPATSYMRNSAYAESGERVPDVRGRVVLFLHDFFDSPHVYHDMVFHDFWEWACFTIDTLSAAGVPFVIKPHPNQIGESAVVLEQLKLRCGNQTFISSAITNKQLVDAGAVCAVTMYGTVAHEMAFLGVPSIACARHPHVSFEFCHTARTRDEYARLLKGAAQVLSDRQRMEQQSLAFYYMHNMAMEEPQLQLRDASLELRRACGRYDETGEEQNLLAKLRRISQLPAFQRFVGEMDSAFEHDEAAMTDAGFVQSQDLK